MWGGVGGVVGMQTRVYFFIFDLLIRAADQSNQIEEIKVSK